VIAGGDPEDDRHRGAGEDRGKDGAHGGVGDGVRRGNQTAARVDEAGRRDRAAPELVADVVCGVGGEHEDRQLCEPAQLSAHLVCGRRRAVDEGRRVGSDQCEHAESDLAEELSGAPALAATAFAVFSVTTAAARFATDSLPGRLGPVALVRGGTLLAAAGLLLALAVHRPAAAIVGFALLGAGLAPAVPIAFSAAGRIDPKAAGRNIARVASIGYVGSVTGPIMIGWLAEATSLRLALGLSAILALVITAAAKILDSQPRPTSPRPTAVLEAA
jgi:hypothetical protein